MRPSPTTLDTFLLSTIFFPLLATSTAINCDHVRVSSTSFDLSYLKGPKSVVHTYDHANGTSSTRTTYTIDLCAPLKQPTGSKAGERCDTGTRVCAIERLIKGDITVIQDAFSIAGDLKDYHGKSLDPKWSLLKESSSHEDSKKDGLLLEMFGGTNEVGDKDELKPQKAIVEFLCDSTRKGDEFLYQSEDKYPSKAKREQGNGVKAKEDEKKDEKEDKSPSLEFVEYNQKGDIDVLRLRWRTQYACADAKGDKDAENNTHWGFFTWFILIAFLSTATYLIFGSWLNYSRYGARGWDLLPHGDAIRDVPYLMKDWTRRVMSSVQGGGSRGGYAAV